MQQLGSIENGLPVGLVALQRGKTPVLVGGTGFYLRWFIYGKPDTPVSNEELATAARAKLDQARATQKSWQEEWAQPCSLAPCDSNH